MQADKQNELLSVKNEKILKLGAVSKQQKTLVKIKQQFTKTKVKLLLVY